MIRKSIIVTLCVLAGSCGASNVCVTYWSTFLVTGRVVDGATGEPVQGAFLSIRLFDEDGQLGDVATAITDDTGEIADALPEAEPEAIPTNRVMVQVLEHCVVRFETWPYWLMTPAPELDPLPDPTRIVLTVEHSEEEHGITIDFTDEMLTQCNDERTSCTIDVGSVEISTD